LEFRILGPLEVLDHGREVSIRGRKRQSLLVLLLLHPGEVVSRDRLIDDLWGEDPPSTAIKTLQVHVSRLRRELGDEVVISRGGGYLIRVEPDQLDLARFERLAAEGREAIAEHQPERAAERLRQALELWRGPPLPELADEPFARAQIGRLEDARLDAIEQRLEAELALGRHAEAIQQLEPLVARHPYRERLHELLMLALYRAGRQADALAAYRDARKVLVEELGLEPGKRLRELHGAILAQDPALEGPAAPEPVPAEGSAAKRRRRLRPLAAAPAALALAALAVVLATRDDEPEAKPLSNDSHAVAVIDPEANRVTTAVSVGSNPGPLAFEAESRTVWVGNVDDESVTRIELNPVRTGKTIAIGERPTGLTAGDGAVWVTAAPRRTPYATARRIDARFDDAGRAVRVESVPGEGTASVALAGRTVWVAPSFGRLTRLDAVTGRRVGPSITASSTPITVAAGAGRVWVADSSAGVVSRIDPGTGIATPIPVPGGPTDLALGAGAAWVSVRDGDALARIDPVTGSVRSTTPVGRQPAAVAVGAGAVWVANSGDGTVSKLDPGSGRVTDTIRVGASPRDIVVADGRVWVSVRPRGEARGASGGTIRVETADDVDFLDPALAYLPPALEILRTTCASLLTYSGEAGAGGTPLAPDLAEALPRRSADGRTYTFRIREGYRFAPTGEPVTARSMKYTIERSLDPRMRSPVAPLMADLVGVTAKGNTLTLRLRRPASDFPARISLSFFCAVPLGTPIEPEGLRKVPSAGPYFVASHLPGEEIVLRRNPAYEGPRPHRPDELRIALARGQDDALARVAAGAVDYTPITTNTRAARRLEARYGAGGRAGEPRYIVRPMLEVDQLYFNTSRPPFSSPRLRRAVSYALDRRALAREGLMNGLPAKPSDQYLPPGMRGFRDARIYPLRPDLARARRLAGPERREAVLYTHGYPSHTRFAEIVKANLAAIGIQVEIRNLGDSLFSHLARRDAPFDLAVGAWAADYPDPTDFLGKLDGRTIRTDGNINLAYFDDPEYNRRLDAASMLPSPARELALGRLDVDVARTAAPWAVVANNRTHDFFSARVGCQRYNPVYGIELGTLCIRRAE
jgi:YVTN family beta-propeller protein